MVDSLPLYTLELHNIMPAVTAPPIKPKEVITLIGMVFVHRGKILRMLMKRK